MILELLLLLVNCLRICYYFNSSVLLESVQGISIGTSWNSFVVMLALFFVSVNLMVKLVKYSISSVPFAILSICIAILDWPLQNHTSPNITLERYILFTENTVLISLLNWLFNAIRIVAQNQ